jgi:hypothetical protein
MPLVVAGGRAFVDRIEADEEIAAVDPVANLVPSVFLELRVGIGLEGPVDLDAQHAFLSTVLGG